MCLHMCIYFCACVCACVCVCVWTSPYRHNETSINTYLFTYLSYNTLFHTHKFITHIYIFFFFSTLHPNPLNIPPNNYLHLSLLYKPSY